VFGNLNLQASVRASGSPLLIIKSLLHSSSFVFSFERDGKRCPTLVHTEPFGERLVDVQSRASASRNVSSSLNSALPTKLSAGALNFLPTVSLPPPTFTKTSFFTLLPLCNGDGGPHFHFRRVHLSSFFVLKPPSSFLLPPVARSILDQSRNSVTQTSATAHGTACCGCCCIACSSSS